MTTNARARLARLETKIRPIRGCDDCVEQVGTVRLVTRDEHGTLLWASRPEHSPTCGTDLTGDPAFTRTICLVGVDSSRL